MIIVSVVKFFPGAIASTPNGVRSATPPLRPTGNRAGPIPILPAPFAGRPLVTVQRNGGPFLRGGFRATLEG